MNAPEKETLSYTLEEFAIATGFSVSTIKKAINEGRLTRRYEKSKPIINKPDGQAWLDGMPTERES